jgi:hypothetical protein
MKHMTKWKLGLLTVAFLLIAISIAAWTHTENSGRSVAEVNGEPILLDEFMAAAMDHRAETVGYFHQKYGAEPDQKEFWNQRYGGESPLEVLKERVLKQLTGIKIQQILAKEAGLLEEPGYDFFLKQLELENNSRKERLAKKEVIFGPQQYDAKTYFNYVFNKMVIELKRTLGETRLAPSDHQLMTYYDTWKDNRFKLPDTIKVKKIYVRYANDSFPGALSEHQALEEITRIQDRLHGVGQALYDEISGDIAAGKLGPSFGYEEHTFLPAARRKDLTQYEALLQAADKLEPGQMEGPIQEADKHIFSIALVAEKTKHGYQKFDDVNEQVKMLYLDHRYEEFIRNQIENAHIEIHSDGYDRIHVE